MRLGTAALVGAALVSVGCSASYPNTFNVREVATVPTDAPDSGPPIPHPLPGFAQRVAAGPEYVVVSTDQGPFRVVGSADAVAMGFVDSSGTSTLGPLTALVPRDPPPPANGDTLPATGLLALAPQGLLLDFTDYFEPSGLPLTAPEQASALDDVGTGDLEIVWIGVPGGVERLGKGASRTFTVSGETTAPTAVLQLSDALALVGFGGKVYELGYTRNEVTSLDHDFGAVHAMARGGAPGEAFLATADGLYARDASGTYAHLLAGKDVGGVAFDPLNGAYFTTADALLLLKADGTLLSLGGLPSASHPLTVDGFGDVWVGSGNQLLQFHVGSPVGYVNQVKPFLAANCFSCHVSQSPGTPASTPKLPFDDYNGTRSLAAQAVQRVQGQGSVMPPSGALPASSYGVIIRWYRSGELP